MNNIQARKTGRTVICCGCVFIILSQLAIGLAFIAVGLLCMMLLGRCPHCNAQLITLPPNVHQCPKCHRPLEEHRR